MREIAKRGLVWVLYGLPVVFFVLCYFALITTEEDMIQGANSMPDVIGDAVRCFFYNARLADMYAWAVINFFNYQYSFGVDTIFRLIDVAGALAILGLMMRIVRGEWKFDLRGGMILGAIFLMIFLTPFGYTLYRGFSLIHNYLIIALALLVFAWPWLEKVRGGEIPKWYKKWWVALAVGLIFGLSSNFPPLAFLATGMVVMGWKLWKERKWTRPERWEILMVGGMILSMAIGYIFGPGVSAYENDPGYRVMCDYATLSEIFGGGGEVVLRLVKHAVINFGRVFGPAIGFLAVGFLGAWVRAKVRGQKLKILPEKIGERKMIGVILIFSIFAVLAGTQIIMPMRLGLAAYIGLVLVSVILMRTWWKGLSEREMAGIGITMVVVMMGIIAVRAAFAWDFGMRAGGALEEVRKAEGETVCVDLAEATQRIKTPMNMFQQEEVFVARAWRDPVIYDKRVVFDCAK